MSTRAQLASSSISASSRRVRPLTHKTSLVVAHGFFEGATDYIADPPAAGEGEGHGHLTELGVERDEASEHHLTAALSRHGLHHTTVSNPSASASFARAAAKPSTAALPAYHIPTPDASKVVDDHARFYPIGSGLKGAKDWADPATYIKFSEKVEECCYGPGGFGYVADDEDLEWLNKFNEREQGSSQGTAAQAAAAPVASGSTRGKQQQQQQQQQQNGASSAGLRISTDVFEYIMGVYETWVDRNVPVLHTNLALLPSFESMSSCFSDTPSASFYPSYEVPRDMLPPAHQLVRMARNVWPHWKERKERRKGKSIIPQLNQDETNENDPYVCFRRRDNKNQRKTRNKDTTSVDRIQRIQGEMLQAQTIALLVVERERRKAKQQRAERDAWRARWDLLDLKRKHNQLNLSNEEESLLFSTRSQPVTKKPRTSHAASERENERASAQPQGPPTAPGSQRNSIAVPRSRQPSPVPEKIPPEQLAAAIAERVEKEIKRKKEMDRHWEDSGDLASQPLPVPAPIKHLRCLPAPATSPDAESNSRIARYPRQICFRLRRGRGGIVRLDRKFPAPALPIPRGLDEDEFDHGLSDVEEEQDEEDVRMTERWKYDADQGRLAYGMGMADDDQVVIDDYETRFIRVRRSLVTAADLDLFKPSNAALLRVQAALDAKPEPPPIITFQRAIPQPPPLQPQAQPAPAPQRPIMEPHQVQQIANQARYIQHAAAAAAGAQPMGPPANGAPQVRRMMSNGPPPRGSPQNMPQNLVNAATAARQGQQSPQVLSAMIAANAQRLPPEQLANLVNGARNGQHPIPVDQLLALGNRTPASMTNGFHPSPNGSQPGSLPPASPLDANGQPILHPANGINAMTAQQMMADPNLRERIMRMRQNQQAAALAAGQSPQEPQSSSPLNQAQNSPKPPASKPPQAGAPPPPGSPGSVMRTGSPHTQPSPVPQRPVHVG